MWLFGMIGARELEPRDRQALLDDLAQAESPTLRRLGRYLASGKMELVWLPQPALPELLPGERL